MRGRPMVLHRKLSVLRRTRSLPACLAAALAIQLLVPGCRATPPPVHDGPIVLITLDALRADVVGALGGIEGLTPNLDALAIESQWASRAIAASSWTVPSMASIFTGLQPWAHGCLHDEQYRLAESLRTLPEGLQEAGYRTVAFRSSRWLTHRSGYGQGFDEFYALGQHRRARARLSTLDGGRQFVWIHLRSPHAPYLKRDPLLDRLAALHHQDGRPVETPDSRTLPHEIEPLDLEPWFDPARELSEADHQRLWAMYLLNVAWADRAVGQMLHALRQSGQWDRTLLVVTSDHGEELGENGQIGHGGSLHRVLVEVPLLVKLPSGFRRVEPTPAPTNGRIYSTLLEAVGVTPTEGTSPPLFRVSRAAAISELYRGNGTNQFALTDGSDQLIWTSHFAPPEDGYYAERRARLGDTTVAVGVDVRARLAASRRAFATTPPLTGLQPPLVQSFRWLDGGGVEPASEVRYDAAALEKVWLQSGPDIAPAQRFAGLHPEVPPADDELGTSKRDVRAPQ